MPKEKNADPVDRFIYIHGFNSSPASIKARIFSDYLARQVVDTARQAAPELKVPALSYDPARAIALLERLVEEGGKCFLIGSSLGGYYATWLVEKYGCGAALINPAVSPVTHLGQQLLGPQVNLYTGEEYELTMEHAESLRRLDTGVLQYPENYFLLVQTGDEVLDYRLAVDKYAGARALVQEGGSHAFENFESVLPAIFRFAGFPVHDAQNKQ